MSFPVPNFVEDAWDATKDFIGNEYEEFGADPWGKLRGVYGVTNSLAIYMMGVAVFTGGDKGRELFQEGARTLATAGLDDYLDILLPDFVSQWVVDKGIDWLSGGAYDIITEAPWEIPELGQSQLRGGYPWRKISDYWQGQQDDREKQDDVGPSLSRRRRDLNAFKRRQPTLMGIDWVQRQETRAQFRGNEGVLIAELHQAKIGNYCVRCTRKGHTVAQCYAVRYPNGEII